MTKQSILCEIINTSTASTYVLEQFHRVLIVIDLIDTLTFNNFISFVLISVWTYGKKSHYTKRIIDKMKTALNLLDIHVSVLQRKP